MAACPKCRSVSLVPDAVGAGAAGAEALRCSRCGGLWFPRSVFEHLRSSPEAVDDERSPMSEAERRTGLCPAGHGVLIRARVEVTRPFHLERCPTCRGFWFDAGEWRRLAEASALGQLDDLWDRRWKQRERARELADSLERSLRGHLGQEIFDELVGLADRLRGHPFRSEALAWLASASDEHGAGRDEGPVSEPAGASRAARERA